MVWVSTDASLIDRFTIRNCKSEQWQFWCLRIEKSQKMYITLLCMSVFVNCLYTSNNLATAEWIFNKLDVRRCL
jgi:hypothetical protein